ncbi:hypothetical protein NC653_011445 [Populus alba x Populus x berolinensis]|uniref:Uncharacterized protein n=1 Tax=Populus alba x Populus x berolinensis TaxID=444605 RepID=A0AAD6W7U1_9ROSI|nr:hypothetical protein NC653_011445 [Populus alba x Populus x berolinensis]
MGEEGEKQTVPPLPPSAAAEETRAPELESDPPTPFDPSRMIGIIKRKGLIKELAAVYHAQCLFYCQQLLDLQKNCQEVTPSLHLTFLFSYSCSIQFLSLKCLSKKLTCSHLLN